MSAIKVVSGLPKRQKVVEPEPTLTTPELARPTVTLAFSIAFFRKLVFEELVEFFGALTPEPNDMTLSRRDCG
jgi:hypothetical protein